jgi:uncharacterized membrane protein YoaK (UPF0700 family)
VDLTHPANALHDTGQPEPRKRSAANDGAFGLALLLAGLAGWVDAAGIAGSGGVFLSFMSGNTTDLAASLVRHDWSQVAVISTVLCLFVAGVLIGELLEPLGGRFARSLILGAEAVLLALGAVLQWKGLAVPAAAAPFKPCPLVFAMGLQNASMHRAGGISIGLTYVTGTLVQIGRALADILRGPGEKGAEDKGSSGGRRLAKYAALWLSLAFGAVLGAAALSLSPFAGLLAAAGIALGLAAATAVTRAGL